MTQQNSNHPGQAPITLDESQMCAFIQGKDKRLTVPQFHVIRALLHAGPEGLTKDELDDESRHNFAYKILNRLRQSDPEWAEVTQMAGRSYGRYRLILLRAPTFGYRPGD